MDTVPTETLLCRTITVHKAQGLTLNAAVVHCAQEFVPGQTYVALSQVRNEASLQVINFKSRFLIPLPEKLKTVTAGDANELVLDGIFSCCKNKELDCEMFRCESQCNGSDGNRDEGVIAQRDGERIASEFYESSSGVQVNLDDVFVCMFADFQ